MDYDLPKLSECIRQSRLGLEYMRSQREKMVRALAGPDWSEETSDDLSRPVNLVELFIRIVTPSLISQGPRVLLSTFVQEAKPAVAAMQNWLNQEIERIEFAETMQRVATDAIFGLGIAKVGLAMPADAAGTAWRVRAGQPFVEGVSLDDFVYDLHARRWSQCSFIGHRIRRPLDAIKDSKLYSGDRKRLRPSYDPSYNSQGDQKASVLGRGWHASNVNDYEDMVDLWEIYLPRERIILTLASDDAGDPDYGEFEKPLRVASWIGPDSGPYHMLGYGLIPDNAMPKGPVQGLFHLDRTVNNLYRKLMRQAQDQKTVWGIAGVSDADAQRIVTTSDGHVIRLENPKDAVRMDFNGPNPLNFQFADHLKQLFGYMAGNMDAFGGLSPQSKTATQDKMLAENSSRLILDMQARTVAYASKVLKSLAWFHWEHPSAVQSYEHTLPGMKRGWTRTLHPRDSQQPLRRQIPFDQLDLRADPYSTMPQTPSSRLEGMNGVVTQIVIPMMQLLAQQGVAFDVNKYLKKVGEYLDMPDLAEILTIQEPIAEASGESHGRTMPGQTERTYTRENVAMRTDKGESQQLRAALSGVDHGGAQTNGQMAEVGA